MMPFDQSRQFHPLSKKLSSLALLLATLLGLSAQDAFGQAEKKFTESEISTALTYKAKQKEVDYDFKVDGRPPADMVKKAQMQSSTKLFGKTGYVLADATNRVVRVLLDTNKDRKLDFFSYYKDGIEVYRETDTDYDSEPNEYRWMGSAGTRWGIDKNQDGEIDQWKVISAEEVAYEVFMAIKTRDDSRYQRLLLTNDEFRSLGLSGAIAKDAVARLEKARKEFPNMVRSQKAIDGKAQWINSGNGQPSLVPAGKGLAKDIVCHDHASSVFQSAAGTDTLALGTLVRVGEAWRLMELPQVVPRGKPIENGGLMFPVVQIVPEFDPNVVDPVDEELAGLYENLTKLESAIGQEGEPSVAMAKLQKDRAMLQWKIYQKIPAKEKVNWLENIGDTVSNAYQEDYYPEGLKFLQSVIKTLRDNKKPEGLDYIRWRMIHADYYKKLEDGDKRQDEDASKDHFKQLEKFAAEFPNSKFAPEALFAIGQNYEVSRSADMEKASRWYQACKQRYGDTEFGKRAGGAVARIGGRGKPVPFKGTTVDGKTFDISNKTLRNRVVVVYFWEMWCADQKANAKGDTAFDVFQDLKSKFKDEVVIVSANIEGQAAAYQKFDGDLKGVFEMHSPGGMENSPLAAQLGIVSEPTMIVWDKKGNMHDSESGVGDLERIIQKLLK
jgi:thiol-disulfide isomerase/thioredoxin